ncbi:MAG: hypothetical protein Q9208_007361 [Pyrenodesmia sp. 3 TL-2023]
MILPNLIDPNLASSKSLDWPSIRIFERPTLCHTSLSRTQCQVSWLTFVTVATFNTVRFTSSRLASIATAPQPNNNNAAATHRAKSMGPEAKPRNKYNFHTHNSTHLMKDGRVRKIRSLNSRELSALQIMIMDDAILNLEKTLDLIHSQTDFSIHAIKKVAKNPICKDYEEGLTAKLATWQDGLPGWDDERDCWYKIREESLGRSINRFDLRLTKWIDWRP